MDIQKLYDPRTAFGNADLIVQFKKIEGELEEQRVKKACGQCDDRGMVEMECDQCNGDGKILVECRHD